jgi:hypothetical protein
VYDQKKAKEKNRQQTRDQIFITEVSPRGQQYARIPSLPMSKGSEGLVYDSGAAEDYEGDRSQNIADAKEALLCAQWIARCTAVARKMLKDSADEPVGRPGDNFSRRVEAGGHAPDTEDRGNVASENPGTYLPCGITASELSYLEWRAARNLAIDMTPERKYDEPEIWACPYHARARFGSIEETIAHLWTHHAGKVRKAAKNGGSGCGTVHDPRATGHYRDRLRILRNPTSAENGGSDTTETKVVNVEQPPN